METTPEFTRRPWVFLLVGLFVALLLAAFLGYTYMHFLHKDAIWKWRVRKQIDIEETRTWALKALAMVEPGLAGKDAGFLLTNAPAYLLKKNYKRNPDVIVGFDCIHLRYGGGMYDWGLTIGTTNLPSSMARGKHVEEWSSGIYFWNN